MENVQSSLRAVCMACMVYGVYDDYWTVQPDSACLSRSPTSPILCTVLFYFLFKKKFVIPSLNHVSSCC